MKIKLFFRTLILFLLFFNGFQLIAQDNDASADEDEDAEVMEKKGFHFGFFVGPYWANKYTASLYDGHGLDVNGNYNEFYSSLIYRKIMEYGGYDPTTGVTNGQPDRIAQVLGVDPASNGGNTWHFGPNDMPQNMHYTINFLVGLNARYSVDKKSAIILNINASKLKLVGNFTIETDVPINQNQVSGSMYVNTFDIIGGEQRMMFQFGYNRIIGHNKRLNFFLEGGLNATLAKFDKNRIVIRSLDIDLTTAYIAPGSGGYTYQVYFPKHVGIGFGAFAGAGFNITISPKWTVQLLYSPTYDKINIGPEAAYKLQHAAGVRCYYNF